MSVTFERWFIQLKQLAFVNKRKLKEAEYYRGWYNAGYYTRDIIDNLDIIHK